jgi:gluconolactonase
VTGPRGPHAESSVFSLPQPGAVTEVASGFVFTEGPAWHRGRQKLTFTDIPASTMYQLEGPGRVSVVLTSTNMANGTCYDREGRLIVCEHATSRLVRQEHDGSWRVLADRFQGKELNSPNDVIVASDGMIYFTDPPYGRSEFVGIPRDVELDVQGVYRLDPERDELTLLTDDLDGPNGLCLSVDETHLYVNDTEHGHVRRYRIDRGRVSEGVLFAEVSAPGQDVVDGLKIDAEGNVYCSGPGGIHVFDASGGSLGVIEVPEVVGNFAWGGPDLRTLYICATTRVYSCQTSVPGNAAF